MHKVNNKVSPSMVDSSIPEAPPNSDALVESAIPGPSTIMPEPPSKLETSTRHGARIESSIDETIFSDTSCVCFTLL